MKKFLVTFLISSLMLCLCGCKISNQNNYDSSNKDNSVTNSIHNDASENKSSTAGTNNSSDASENKSLNEIKDDAYYEQLIADMPSIPSNEETIEEALLNLSSNIDLILYTDEDVFDDINQYSIERMFYFATANYPFDDEFTHSMNEKDEYLFREEIIEKIVFYYFNYKIDCKKLKGYSKNEKGIRYAVEGYGGIREPTVLSFTKTQNGYEMVVGFLDPHKLESDQEEVLMEKRTFRYDKVGNRYCLSAISGITSIG